jgi:predicted nucleic acid-binding protein
VAKKNYSDYSDKLIIADASPLIELDHLGKIDYLHKLFKNVSTTETVKKECKFDLPEWMDIEEPKEDTKRIFRKLGFEKGELTAIALAYEKNIKNDDNSCVILDDKPAKNLIDKNKLSIKHIGLLQVMNFAYQQKFFDKDYISVLVEEMTKHKFRVPDNASDIIYGEKYYSASRGTKR